MEGKKKLSAAIAGVIVSLAAFAGLDLDVEQVATVIAPIVAYIVGQGIADNGKEAAKANVSNVTVTTSADFPGGAS